MGGTAKRWRSVGKSAGEREGKSVCTSRWGGEMLSHFSMFGRKWIDSMTPVSPLASADSKKSLKRRRCKTSSCCIWWGGGEGKQAKVVPSPNVPRHCAEHSQRGRTTGSDSVSVPAFYYLAPSAANQGARKYHTRKEYEKKYCSASNLCIFCLVSIFY